MPEQDFPRLTRGRRRVLLALLTDIPMTQLTLMETAQADSGTVNVTLAALRTRGWAVRDYEPRTNPSAVPQMRRVQYWLTLDGRRAVQRLLGLGDKANA